VKQAAVHKFTVLTLCPNTLVFSIAREMSKVSPNCLGTHYNSWAQITTVVHDHFQTELPELHLGYNKYSKRGIFLLCVCPWLWAVQGERKLEETK